MVMLVMITRMGMAIAILTRIPQPKDMIVKMATTLIILLLPRCPYYKCLHHPIRPNTVTLTRTRT
jgi:hypothetical protein